MAQVCMCLQKASESALQQTQRIQWLTTGTKQISTHDEVLEKWIKMWVIISAQLQNCRIHVERIKAGFVLIPTHAPTLFIWPSQTSCSFNGLSLG